MAVNFPLSASFQSLDDSEKFSSLKKAKKGKKWKRIPERIPLKLFFERRQRFFWRAEETQTRENYVPRRYRNVEIIVYNVKQYHNEALLKWKLMIMMELYSNLVVSSTLTTMKKLL